MGAFPSVSVIGLSGAGVHAVAGTTIDDVIGTAAIAEKRSEHPLAQAVLRKAMEASLRVTDPDHFSYTPGKGLICSAAGEEIVVGNKALFRERCIDLNGFGSNGNPSSQILVGRRGRLLGVLEIADRLRPEAIQAVAELRRMGLRVILLTGDSERIARAVAKELGIDELEAELLPEQKVARIQALIREGGTSRWSVTASTTRPL